MDSGGEPLVRRDPFQEVAQLPALRGVEASADVVFVGRARAGQLVHERRPGPGQVDRVVPPVIGQAAWILWNRLPAVQRAKIRREDEKKQALSALAGMRTAMQSQVRTETVEDAEYAAAQSDAPIDVGGLARTLDEIRDKK